MIRINEGKCIGCGMCIEDCLVKDIDLNDGYAVPKNRQCINCGHCVAICPSNAVELIGYDMSEVLEYNKEDFVLDPDQYLNAIKYRRTIRKFSDKEVEMHKIKNIIESGRYSPTGGNLQNVSYCVIREDVETLKELAIIELNQIADFILNSEEPSNIERYARMWKEMYRKHYEKEKGDTLFFDSSTIILVVSESVQNGSIAAAHMETMVYAQGLGMLYSGFFTRAAAQSEKIREYLGIGGKREVVACMVVGYPGVEYMRTAPRKKAEIIWK